MSHSFYLTLLSERVNKATSSNQYISETSKFQGGYGFRIINNESGPNQKLIGFLQDLNQLLPRIFILFLI